MIGKKILIILFLLFPLIGFEKGYEDIPEKKEWIYGEKLTWEDFKGKPDVASKNAAMTSSIFEYHLATENDSVIFKTSCFFRKDLSWVRVKTDYILDHEQLHFDITEYYKRKFESRSLNLIRQYKLKNYNTLFSNIKMLFENFWKENQAEQILYDKETNHSKNIINQKKWRKKYNELLVIYY